MTYMLIGAGELAGHMFDSRADAEGWMRQPCVRGLYGLDEVSVSRSYCRSCCKPRPKVIRRVHDVGALSGEDAGQ